MQEYTITQLTDNDVDDTAVQTSKGNAVWSASDGNDDEIFLYDGDSTRRLTYNDAFDNIPQISGDNLVWQQTEDEPLLSIFGGSEILVYDGETIETIADLDSFTIPAISGDNVVWGDGLFGGTVSLYDGQNISELTDSGVFIPINSSSVSGDNVVWMSGFDEEFAGFGDIFLYDGETTTEITDNANDNLINVLPSISGNNIAWTAAEVVTGNETGEIFYYDGTQTIQLTDNNIQDAVIGVSEDNVIWASGDGVLESNLFLYDGIETIQLTSDNTETFTGGSISGNKVVWSESDGNDTEVFLYDGQTTIQITDNDRDDNLPDIDGDTIVWEAEDGQDTEIFLATLNESENESNSNSTDNSFSLYSTGTNFYTANETESDAVENIDYSFRNNSNQNRDSLTVRDEFTGIASNTIIEPEISQDMTDFSFTEYVLLDETGTDFYTPSLGENSLEESQIDDLFAETTELILPSETEF